MWSTARELRRWRVLVGNTAGTPERRSGKKDGGKRPCIASGHGRGRSATMNGSDGLQISPERG